jgi:hypothetical protein
MTLKGGSSKVRILGTIFFFLSKVFQARFFTCLIREGDEGTNWNLKIVLIFFDFS